ncbi:MAG: hypothetical protein IJW22_08330 [Clostridia bacterium]|nr:hypothetical protein [Clostridia bacterium]
MTLQIILLAAGVLTLFGVLLFVLDEPKISTWPWLLTSVFLITTAGIMLYNRYSRQRLH